MTSIRQAPVLFISHGAPTFAIEPGILGARLQYLGRHLLGIKAVLVALGAQGDGDSVQLTEGGITHGELSMDSYVWGMAPAVVGAAAQQISRRGSSLARSAIVASAGQPIM